MEAPNAFYAIAVWRRHRDAFLRNWTTEAGGVLLEPLIVLGAIGFGLGQFVGDFEGDVDYATFVAPGIIAGYAMFHALFEGAYGAYLRMATHRVFDSILATPMQVEDLVLGEMLWGASRSVLTAIMNKSPTSARATVAQSVRAPTCTGEDSVVVLPWPSWPLALAPHVHNVSSVLTA